MREWLEANQVMADQVLQHRDLLDFGLSLTPTLLMVDASGSVTDVILGRLTATDESVVMNRLKEPTSTSTIDNTSYVNEISQEAHRRSGRKPRLLDIRDRDAYVERGRAGSTNIPSDELSTRAPLELDPSEALLVDCVGVPFLRCRAAGKALTALGFSEIELLMP